MGESVYALNGSGFLCLPRSIPDRLAKQHYLFEEADALLDLWCHTVWQEPKNIFSHMAPTVQFGSLGAVLTLETLGRRWGWEKTKVWRFFKNMRMPSLYTVCPAPTAAWCSTPSTPRRAPPRHGDFLALPGGTSAHNRGTAFLRGKCAHRWERQPAAQQDGPLVQRKTAAPPGRKQPRCTFRPLITRVWFSVLEL